MLSKKSIEPKLCDMFVPLPVHPLILWQCIVCKAVCGQDLFSIVADCTRRTEIGHELDPNLENPTCLTLWTLCQNIVCGNILCGILEIRRLRAAEFEYQILFVEEKRFSVHQKVVGRPVAEPKSFSELCFRNQLWCWGMKLKKCLLGVQYFPFLSNWVFKRPVYSPIIGSL